MPRASLICSFNTVEMERICVMPKDVAALTGLSERYAQQLLKDLKILLNKKKHQFITKYELATYMDIDPNLIHLK